MSQYISDNDDDLFEYEPAEENKDSLLQKYSEQQYDYINSEKDSHQIEIGNSVLAKTLSETFDKENDLDSITLSNASVYRALINAMESFVETDKTYYLRTQHQILDELTQGKFSLTLVYNVLEIRIAAKKILYNTLNAVFNDNSSKEIELFVELASKLSYEEISNEFLTGSIRTSISILDFTIKLDQILYLHIAEKLNQPIKEILFENDKEDVDIDLQNFIYERSYTEYLRKLEENMLCAFSLSATNVSQTETENQPKKINLLERLSEHFEKEVRYTSKNIN